MQIGPACAFGVVQALIAWKRGLLEQAAQARKAMELHWAAADVRHDAEGLEVCAIVLAVRSGAEAAARLLGAVAAQRKRLHELCATDFWARREDVDEGVASARAALSAGAWEAAFAAGSALALEDAVTEALKVNPCAYVMPSTFSTVFPRGK